VVPWSIGCRRGWCRIELWELVQPLIPEFRRRPQGGGTAPVNDRAVFTAVVFGYRRLVTRYERHAVDHCASTTLAAALTCVKQLVTATT
jgi:hypothetical protein